MRKKLELNPEELRNLKLLLILTNVEYCFSIEYDRDETVIFSEFENLEASFNWIINMPLEEIGPTFDEDYIKECLESLKENPEIISDEYHGILMHYINTCYTASQVDKEKALALLSQIKGEKDSHITEGICKYAKPKGSMFLCSKGNSPYDYGDCIFHNGEINLSAPVLCSEGLKRKNNLLV